MSLVVKEDVKEELWKWWIFSRTNKKIKRTLTYEGKVVNVTQRWIDGGFEAIKRGCFITLQKDGKLKEVTCAGIETYEAIKLLDGKTIRITQHYHNKFSTESYNYSSITLDDVEILQE